MPTNPSDARRPSGASSSEEEDAPREKSADSSPPAQSAGPEGLPLQGTHQGSTDDALTSSVRAQEPPDPTPPAEQQAEEDAEEEAAPESAGKGDEAKRPEGLGTYQLSRDPESGRHRVRMYPQEGKEKGATGEGFEELSRHDSPEEASDALEGGLPDGPRFVVLENTETGETYFDRESALSDDWFADGRFDQVTIFDREEEAAAYADR